MGEHDLKVWPEYFGPLERGEKTAELRYNDRGFAVGDVLRLREYDPQSGEYTGREIRRTVTHIVTQWLGEGYVMMSLDSPAQAEAAALRRALQDIRKEAHFALSVAPSQEVTDAAWEAIKRTIDSVTPNNTPGAQMLRVVRAAERAQAFYIERGWAMYEDEASVWAEFSAALRALRGEP